MHVRSPYNYDRDAASRESGLKCLDKSRTKQEFKEECDINTLVKRFGITGELPQNVRMPISEDFVAALNFHDAMNAIKSAEASFSEMPAVIRKRFDNDAAKFVAFCDDAKNRDEAVKLGLIPPVVAPVTPVVAAATLPSTPPT